MEEELTFEELDRMMHELPKAIKMSEEMKKEIDELEKENETNEEQNKQENIEKIEKLKNRREEFDEITEYDIKYLNEQIGPLMAKIQNDYIEQLENIKKQRLEEIPKKRQLMIENARKADLQKSPNETKEEFEERIKSGLPSKDLKEKLEKIERISEKALKNLYSKQLEAEKNFKEKMKKLSTYRKSIDYLMIDIKPKEQNNETIENDLSKQQPKTQDIRTEAHTQTTELQMVEDSKQSQMQNQKPNAKQYEESAIEQKNVDWKVPSTNILIKDNKMIVDGMEFEYDPNAEAITLNEIQKMVEDLYNAPLFGDSLYKMNEMFLNNDENGHLLLDSSIVNGITKLCFDGVPQDNKQAMSIANEKAKDLILKYMEMVNGDFEKGSIHDNLNIKYDLKGLHTSDYKDYIRMMKFYNAFDYAQVKGLKLTTKMQLRIADATDKIKEYFKNKNAVKQLTDGSENKQIAEEQPNQMESQNQSMQETQINVPIPEQIEQKKPMSETDRIAADIIGKIDEEMKRIDMNMAKNGVAEVKPTKAREDKEVDKMSADINEMIDSVLQDKNTDFVEKHPLTEKELKEVVEKVENEQNDGRDGQNKKER